MLRRIIAVALAAALAVCMTACGKGTKNPENKSTKEQPEEEKKEPRQPSGYRCYVFEDARSGSIDQSRRWLYEEYEDLVTEATYKKYDEDATVTDLTRWYYDDNGEILLKEVHWTSDAYAVTKATEYDLKGRKIRYSEKQEHEFQEGQAKPQIPGEFQEYLLNSLDYYYFDVGNEVKELVTEYTYAGDSDKLAGMKSVTDAGDIVASVEFGDGDIVLSRKFEQENWRLEETYDPNGRKGTWNYYNWNISFEGDWGWILYAWGSNDYDESGRIVCSKRYDMDLYNQFYDQNYLSEETVFTYVEGGTVSKKKTYDESGVVINEETQQLDAAGRVVHSESTDFNENGEILSKIDVTCTYHENGERASFLRKYSYSSQPEMRITSDVEYDENGEMIADRTYDDEGRLSDELEVSFPEMTNVSGKVKCSRWISYSRDTDHKTYERYEVCMKTPYGDGWYTFRVVTTDWNDRTKEDDCHAIFDADGHLLKVDTNFGETYVEFDTQGRIIHDMESGNTDWEYEYEYWEGEDQRPSGETE